jgi:hypothetical protein|tara:strand:- start:808 stop:1158 length:351 start_codon:yes stop_codon:yes gene_type:complete
MKLYTFAVVFFIGVAGIFSNYYNSYTSEIYFGLLAPIFVGYLNVFFIKKYSNIEAVFFNRILFKLFAMKFIFYGTFILIIFTVYSFNPIPFICSFTPSFIGLHMVEAIISGKVQSK